MNTGTTYKRIKRRFKRKLYHVLVALNDMDFARLRPVCYLLLLAAICLVWANLPSKETTDTNAAFAGYRTSLAASVRSAVSNTDSIPVDVVALFLPKDAATESLSLSGDETLYSFYLTGNELSYLAEGAITTITKNNTLYLDGLNYTYHKNRLPFNRVTSLSLTSGPEIESETLYRVISTEDIFALFHYISYRSINILSISPKDASGHALSDYQEVLFTSTGVPLTSQNALSYSNASAANALCSTVTIQSGFNLKDLITEPNRVTICAVAMLIAFFSLLWYIVPRVKRIRLWFRIYLIRRRKRSTHSLLYGLRKRY